MVPEQEMGVERSASLVSEGSSTYMAGEQERGVEGSASLVSEGRIMWHPDKRGE